MNPEATFRTYKVIPFLKKLPNTWYTSIQAISIKGIPDILACVSGQFMALELKASKGRVTPLQQHTLNKITLAGGCGYVVSPENWDEIKSILLQISTRGNTIYDHTHKKRFILWRTILAKTTSNTEPK